MLRWLFVFLFVGSLCFSTIGCGGDEGVTTPPPEKVEGETEETPAPELPT